ncbi:MAG: hypothetical protein J1F11_01520 [Oscillospiraceae bacterium]|nr:hypothetical protein [Oscillospiraceae bacterium]
MLDIKRLLKNELLIKNGWTPEHKINISDIYAKIYDGSINSNLFPQVAIEKIFPKAFEIIEVLEGTTIKNLHTELGLGEDLHIIEFDYFNYDISNNSELEKLSSEIGKSILFLGIGYDIIGDWLIDSDGIIYFLNSIRKQLHPFSLNIYDFLEKDIYNLTDLNNEYIL